MALPPQDSAQFEKEVDEEYRRQRVEDFSKTYGKWIAIALVVFLAAVGGYLYWQSEQRAAEEEQTERLATVSSDIGDPGEAEGMNARLAEVAGTSTGATRAAALFLQAADHLDKGQREEARALFEAMSSDEEIPEPYRNAALLRWTLLDFDNVEPDAVIARLQPLAQPGNPFFGTAGELTALALIELEREEEAANLFKQIAEDQDAPRSLRRRSVQIAGTYGVDATAALADIEGQE